MFLDLPDGRILTFGGAGGIDADASAPSRKCIDMLSEAFVSWPLHGEDPGIEAERREIEANLQRFKPNGDNPYICVYDLAPVCRSNEEADELTERIRKSVADGKWLAVLGSSLEVRDRRLTAVAPPTTQRLLREFLEGEGMSGGALDPLPPERLFTPRRFSQREIATVQTARGDPRPEQLLLSNPVGLESPAIRRLSGARLWIAIQNEHAHPDNHAVAAIRSRSSPLLVCAVLARLMEKAEQDADKAGLAELNAIAQRWAGSAPWSTDFISFFRLLVRSDHTLGP